MVSEALDLFPEVREAQAPAGRGLHGYYRKSNGWIVTGPTTKGNRDDFEYMGHEFLGRYGQFKNVDDLTHEVDTRNAPWNSYKEPWRVLFQRGGAKEFPIDQIIAYHWHLKPPYRQAEFPQIEGVKIHDFFCPECDNGIFSSTNEREAARMLRQHLMSRSNEAHNYRVEDLQKLGQEWGIDLMQPAGARSVRRSQVVEDAPDLEGTDSGGFSDVDTGFRCNECSAEFETAKALGGHKMGAHRNPAPV